MTICWFGIYDPEFGRNRIYREGLRAKGVHIVDCRDTSPGLSKYWRLWRKHRALRGTYDAMVVGYPGHVVVPLARLISLKPVVADLLCSLGDAEYHSHRPTLLRRLKSGIADRLAIWCAHIVLVDCNAQRDFFIRRFGLSRKYRVLYTGADESVFHAEGAPIAPPSIVLFRGSLTPESGILHILEAARLLRDDHSIRFRIIGTGLLKPQVERVMLDGGLSNVECIYERLDPATLRSRMSEASLSLGQFEDNPRLSRTIPHKAFESFAMGIPYLTGDTPAAREMVSDAETGFLVRLADPAALAARIRSCIHDKARLSRVSAAAQEAFEARFASAKLAEVLIRIVSAKE